MNVSFCGGEKTKRGIRRAGCRKSCYFLGKIIAVMVVLSLLLFLSVRGDGGNSNAFLPQEIMDVQAADWVGKATPGGRYRQPPTLRTGSAMVRSTTRAYDPLFDRADEPSGIAVTPDGSTLYLTAHKSHNVFVIDVDTRQVLDCIDPTEGGTIEILVAEIAITPDGRWGIITNPVWRQELQGSYTILDLADNSIVDTVFFDNGASGQPQPLPDGNTVCIAGDGPPRVYFVDIPTLSTTTTVDLHEPTIDLRTFVIGLSPDGNTLYAIGPYGVPYHCRLVSIDTATRTVDQVIEVAIPDVENLSDVEPSPDGTKLYVAHGIAQKVYVLDLLNNGEVLAEIDFDQVVQTIEFSVDGAVAYVGGFCPGGVYAVDTSTYSIMALINPPGTVISDAHELDIAPDGSLLFVAGADADGVFFIDVATSEVVTYINLNPIDMWPQQVALSNDGRWLYTAGVEYSHPGRVYVIDTEMRAVVEHIPIDSPLIASGTGTDFQGFGLSPDGTLLYTHGSARAASNLDHLLSLVIDLNTKQVIDAIDLGSIQPDCGDKVAVSIDGNYIYYMQTAEERVVVASIASMQVIAEVPLGFWPIDIGLSHDGTTAFVSGGEPRHVAVINLATNTVIDVIDGTTNGHPGWHGMGLAVAPDDSEVWWGSGLIEIIDVATLAIVDSIELLPLLTAGDRGATPFGVTYSPDGSKVFVANFDANNLMIFDASTRELLHKINVGFSPTDIAVSPDSNEAYVLNSQSETISVIDVAAGAVVATISLREIEPPPTYSIDYVVAHWVSGALDPNDPCQISLDQILQAIAWWAAATPVPHTGGQTIDLDKILDLIAKWAAATCIDSSAAPQSLLLPKALSADEAALVVEATRSIASTAEGQIEVTVTVEAKQAITGLALDEDLPQGWKITPIDNAGATFNAQETQWLWLEVNAGETKVIRYQVEIPSDASADTLYEITGVIRAASPSLVLEVVGDVQLEERLPGGKLEVVAIPNPVRDVHTVTFHVQGALALLVEAVRIQIFDLAGRLVYEREEAGTSLDWHTDDSYGEYLANGVYLYKLYALIEGRWIVSEVKKLAILM